MVAKITAPISIGSHTWHDNVESCTNSTPPSARIAPGVVLNHDSVSIQILKCFAVHIPIGVKRLYLLKAS